MKAIVGEKYGDPESLELREVEKPIPKDNEVLVEVRGSSLNAADFERLRGSIFTRMTGLRYPKDKIPGTDVAGIVESVGKEVTEFQPGDEVVGDLMYVGSGAFAEYVAAPQEALTMKPTNMTFEEVATYPQAAIIALQCLRGKKKIQPGQSVLINGGGGGMGTFAVQIAKYYKAEVTAVDSAEKLDILKSIGADHTINYKQIDFTKTGNKYDVIIDTVANRSIRAYRRALNKNGMFIMVGGSRGAIFQAFTLGPLFSMVSNKWTGINWWSEPINKKDMDFLGELYDAKKVVPIIEKQITLDEIPEELTRLEDGKVIGKIAISMKEGFS
ncbi:MAG: NAD(P)-dependent alcohol dehydrogenase [Candidatus Thorarchaeota archaeon]